VTDVAFHFNAPDPVAYACRLLRKAVGSGAKVVVIADEQTLSALNAALWTFSSIDFLAHCDVNSDASVLAMSPVILATHVETTPHRQILLNLAATIPLGFELFKRVIEVVALDDDSRQSARTRWKQYVDLGYDLTRHDLNLKPS
jgi:DNA polymerase-3 subunit chi